MTETGHDDEEYGVVLDVLPRGRSDAEEPQYRRSPVAYAVGEDTFALFELTLGPDADISIDDRIRIRPDFDEGIERGHQIQYGRLTDGARSELTYVVEEIVDAHKPRYVNFFNEAQPVTLRLHQLNLLPGIGDKLRDNVIEERKRGPFESFEELEERVSGLHDPKEILVERILQEVTEAEDLKYHLFVRS